MKTLTRICSAFVAAALLLPALAATAARETRAVDPFTGVTLAGSMKVVLTQGSPQKVEVDAQPEDLAQVETAVRNGKLRVGTKQNRSGMNWSSYRFKGPVTVYVTAPTLTALGVSGSGIMQADGPVKADKLDLSISGSGRLELAQVQTDNLDSSVSGSGNIVVSGGAASRQEISISGSGGVQAPKLRTETCSVHISGSGNCRVQATQALEASIAGSGDVYVTGNPKVNSSVAGSGRVHRE